MIFPRIIPVPFHGRGDLAELYNHFGNDADYIDAVWKKREPVAPVLQNKGGYPIVRVIEPVKSNVHKLRKPRG